MGQVQWIKVCTDIFDNEKMKKLLSLPEKLIPLNVIAIGYPAEHPTPKDKWNVQNVTLRK